MDDIFFHRKNQFSNESYKESNHFWSTDIKIQICIKWTEMKTFSKVYKFFEKDWKIDEERLNDHSFSYPKRIGKNIVLSFELELQF